jgi:hypothetical protein
MLHMPNRKHPDEAAHDVLAAEAFAVPAPDPALCHKPVVLPDDPSGIPDAHDILAAEEFAMPAPPSGRSAARATLDRAAESPLRTGLAALAGMLGLAALRRRLR